MRAWTDHADGRAAASAPLGRAGFAWELLRRNVNAQIAMLHLGDAMAQLALREPSGLLLLLLAIRSGDLLPDRSAFATRWKGCGRLSRNCRPCGGWLRWGGDARGPNWRFQV